MARLFFSITPPEELIQELILKCGGISGARWSPPENLHITLLFLGETPNQKINEVINLAENILLPPFTCQLSGAGQFPLRGVPKTLWLGVKPTQSLTELQAQLVSTFRGAGYPIEKRKFMPHLSLAKLKTHPTEQTHQWLHAQMPYQSAPFEVTHFNLMSSRLFPQGAKHTQEEVFKLI